MIRQSIVISDTHCGCQYGLCPPHSIRLDGGGKYEPSENQKRVYAWWDIFWNEWVPKVTREEPYAVVVNGDTTDGRHHKSTTQVSQNLADQRHIAEELLFPIVEKCNGQFYMIRGTEAHIGPSGESEETLADTLKAIPDNEGNRARWDMYLRLGGPTGCLVHITHHIGTTGSSHYESSAPMRELAESFSDAGRWGGVAPDVIIRSHRHRSCKVEVPTERGYGIVAVTPGWQLKTPFVYKIPGGRITTPQFGGILVRQGDEEHYTRHKIWNIKRTPEVVL